MKDLDIKKKFSLNKNLELALNNNKVLLLKTDLPEYLIMGFLHKILIEQNKNYLNAITKKFIINVESQLFEYNSIVVNNRNIFNRNSKLKLVFKNDLVNFKNFEKYIECNFGSSKPIFIEISKNRFICIPFDTKIIFIQSGTPVFSKKMEKLLIENQFLEIIEILSLEISSEIIFYKQK